MQRLPATPMKKGCFALVTRSSPGTAAPRLSDRTGLEDCWVSDEAGVTSQSTTTLRRDKPCSFLLPFSSMSLIPRLSVSNIPFKSACAAIGIFGWPLGWVIAVADTAYLHSGEFFRYLLGKVGRNVATTLQRRRSELHRMQMPVLQQGPLRNGSVERYIDLITFLSNSSNH